MSIVYKPMLLIGVWVCLIGCERRDWPANMSPVSQAGAPAAPPFGYLAMGEAGVLFKQGLAYSANGQELLTGRYKGYGELGHYQQGLKEGAWLSFLPDQPKYRQIYHYRQGVLQEVKAYGDDHGLVASQALRNGLWVDALTGQPYSGHFRSVDEMGVYVEGRKHGVWRVMVPNSLPPYQNRDLYHYEAGVLRLIEHYRHGVWQGAERYWQQHIIDRYQARRPYDRAGRAQSAGVYHNGVLMPDDQAHAPYDVPSGIGR